MSIDHSDQLHLPDAPDLDPSLEATVTPKSTCIPGLTLDSKIKLNVRLTQKEDVSFAYDDGGNGPNDDGRGEAEHVRETEVGLQEGRGENDGQGASQRPSVHRTGGEKTVSTGESSARHFGELPFTPVWGLTDSDCMLEAGKKESDESVVSQAERIKSLEVALKESETGVEQLRSDREKFVVAAGKGEMIRKRLITEYFPTFFQRLLQSKEYKESVGEVLSLPVGKGFIDGISLGRAKADVDALLKASPGVNPASSDIFIGEYLKLFEMHYPYMDKVTCAYLLDPSELQNVMPVVAGPTPGDGPRPSSTAHS
ncbi:hypothetical protein Tco_1174810 [Tanacetum coccineum]